MTSLYATRRRPEQVSGLPYLRVRVRRDAIARHGISLGLLAEVIDEEGPARISRENVERRISVEVNVRQNPARLLGRLGRRMPERACGRH